MRIAKGLLIAVCLALALAGCAKPNKTPGIATAGKGTATVTPTPTASMSDQERVAKFGDCMRANGIAGFQDPKVDGGAIQMTMPDGTDKAKADAAMAKCRQYMPGAGEPPKIDAQQVEQQRKYAQCMRANGLPNFPDPDASGGVRIDLKDLGVTGPDDPKLVAAQKACDKYAPTPPSGAATHVDGGTGGGNLQQGRTG